MLLTDFAAHSYTSGRNVQDALAVCSRLGRCGMEITTCYWNAPGDDAATICAAYLQLIHGIGSLPGRPYISIKPAALDFDDALLGAVVSAAIRYKLPVHFDALAHKDARATFEAIERCQHVQQEIGCTLPARWKRSPDDAEQAVALGLQVRVVKGEWPDPDDPGKDMQLGYLDVVDRLAGRAKYVALATHDVELARESISRLQKAGTRCGLEVLYGVPPRPMHELARSLQLPLRIYVPCGRAWLPYRLKQIPHDPRIAAWFIRDLVRAAVK